MKAANRIWEIAYPVLMYYASISVGIFLAQLIFGVGNENYILCKMIGSVAAIAVVYQDYKNDKIMTGRVGEKTPISKEMLVNILAIAEITICISISLNNLISMSPLVQVSTEYENANNALYGSGSLVLELLGSAIITPFLEEMLHRGVVYGRLRRRMGMWPSVLISALIFAALHFNIVQFIYAFLLGVVFAIFMEKTKRLYAPVFAHMVANGIAVLRTETGFLQSTVDGSMSAWLISIGLLLLGIGGLLVYGNTLFSMNKETK